MKYIIGIIAVLAIVGGAYYYFFMNGGTTAPTTTQDQGAAAAAAISPDQQVQGQDVTVGTGEEAKPGSIVTLEYEGRFQDGTVFDSSASRGQPLVFQLGAQGIIPGFQIGVNTMKVGGERTILIPPSLGYGTTDIKDPEGKVIIPANSTLIFNIKLLKVEPGPENPAQ